jgi:hypothetical protein
LSNETVVNTNGFLTRRKDFGGRVQIRGESVFASIAKDFSLVFQKSSVDKFAVFREGDLLANSSGSL